MFHLHHVPENFPAVIKMTVNQNCNIKKKKNWHISVAITAINCLIRSLPRQRTISSQANQNHCCSKEHGGQGLHPLIQVHHWHPGHSDTTGFGFHKNKVFLVHLNPAMQFLPSSLRSSLQNQTRHSSSSKAVVIPLPLKTENCLTGKVLNEHKTILPQIILRDHRLPWWKANHEMVGCH